MRTAGPRYERSRTEALQCRWGFREPLPFSFHFSFPLLISTGHRWGHVGRCRRMIPVHAHGMLHLPFLPYTQLFWFPGAQFCAMPFSARATLRHARCPPHTELIWLMQHLLGGKMTLHRGDDFGRHTWGGRGDRDTRIEISPGRQGDDLKTMLASC